MKSKKTITCREAAYLAYLSSLREKCYVSEYLSKWEKNEEPSEVDFNLAQEIAYGTCQRALTLEYFANTLVDKKLKLKRKEKALLLTALYQHFFLERVPLYAITNETIQISKKYLHNTFTKFLNAFLRKLPDSPPELPADQSLESLSIKYSYPQMLIEKLIIDYGKETAVNIMNAGNTPSVTLARIRSNAISDSFGCEAFPDSNVNMVCIKNKEQLVNVQSSSNYYIQNITPFLLFNEITRSIDPPQSILDLCSSPGGKLISAHDRFPKAQLFANDVSEEKVRVLKQNIDQFNLDAHVTCGMGQDYPTDQKFDLVILDVPCSNTGVLNKRAEARWRISQNQIDSLNTIQTELIKKALSLITPNGHILYMTCSILKDENERFIQSIAAEMDLQVEQSKTIIPSTDGYDGGFAALLTKK